MDKEVIHIGRVAIDKNHRGEGIGHKLILGCEDIAKKNVKQRLQIIELSAQVYAETFYKKLCYNRINNNIYIDAGIEHIDMRKNNNKLINYILEKIMGNEFNLIQVEQFYRKFLKVRTQKK